MPVAAESRRVKTRVFAILTDFKQVRVEALDGFQYAITEKTPGVDWSALHEGQFVDCLVTTSALPRIIEAHALA